MTTQQWKLLARFMFWVIYYLNRQYMGAAGVGAAKLESDLSEELNTVERE